MGNPHIPLARNDADDAMGRQVKKLSGLEIDEVSLVDRPANQHGLVAICKREDDDMPAIFDADGDPVDEEELEHGDLVYDTTGAEFVFVEDDTDDDGEEVGKSAAGAVLHPNNLRGANAGGYAQRARAGKDVARRGLSDKIVAGAYRGGQAVGNAQSKGRELSAAGAKKLGRGRATAAHSRYQRAADRGMPEGGFGQGVNQFKANRAADYANHPYAHVAGGVGAAGAGGEGARRHFKKSLGDQVLTDLSKAFTDNDRDEVIAKAMDYIGSVAQDNEDLRNVVEQMQEQRGYEDFTELAKSYELPIDPESIGGLMQRASQFMDPADVSTMDRLFSSMGEFAKNDGYNQIGWDGQGESEVLDQVYAIVGQELSKSDTGLSPEQAMTAVFSQNDAAYEQYEADMRSNRR